MALDRTVRREFAGERYVRSSRTKHRNCRAFQELSISFSHIHTNSIICIIISILRKALVHFSTNLLVNKVNKQQTGKMNEKHLLSDHWGPVSSVEINSIISWVCVTSAPAAGTYYDQSQLESGPLAAKLQCHVQHVLDASFSPSDEP